MGCCLGRTRSSPVHFDGMVNGEMKDWKWEGKSVLITGANSGLGKICTRVVSSFGCKVFMLCRREDAAQEVIDACIEDGLATKAQFVFVKCDLCDFSSVVNAAARVRDLAGGAGGIDLLLNNAGCLGGDIKATGDNLDRVLQTNHVSHFLLTALLWPLLQEAAEVSA